MRRVAGRLRELPRFDRRETVAAVVPVLVSLAIAIVFHASANAPQPEADALIYHRVAMGIVGQNADPTFGFDYALTGMFVRGFVHPAFVAAVYTVVGAPNVEVATWIQGVLLVPLIVLLTYLAGRIAFRHRVGVIASAAVALWFPITWHTKWLMSEAIVGVVVAVVLMFLALLVRRPAPATALCFGIAAAMLSLAHTAYQFLPIVLAVAVVAHFLLYARKALIVAAVAIIGMAVILVPYHAVRVIGDYPRLGEGGGGLGYGGGGGWTFWAGSRAATDFYPLVDDYEIADANYPCTFLTLGPRIRSGDVQVERHLRKTIFEKLAAPDAPLQTLEDRDYYRAGVANLLDHPDEWPRKIAVEGKQLFFAPDDLYFYEPSPHRGAWFLEPWRTLSIVVFVLMLLGLGRLLLERRDRVVLFVPVVWQSAITIAAIGQNRYLLPLIPSVLLLAVIAIFGPAGGAERFLGARRRASVATAAVFVVAAAGAGAATAAPPASIKVKPPTVDYGDRSVLSGALSTREAGQAVELSARFCGAPESTPFATVHTGRGGTFGYVLQPIINTTYEAALGGETLARVTTWVRPRLVLRRLAGDRFSVRVLAAQSFAGRRVLLQRFEPARDSWVTFDSVRLAAGGTTMRPITGTTVSQATFRAPGAPGTRLRVVLTMIESRGAYRSATSNAVTAPTSAASEGRSVHATMRTGVTSTVAPMSGA